MDLVCCIRYKIDTSKKLYNACQIGSVYITLCVQRRMKPPLAVLLVFAREYHTRNARLLQSASPTTPCHASSHTFRPLLLCPISRAPHWWWDFVWRHIVLLNLIVQSPCLHSLSLTCPTTWCAPGGEPGQLTARRPSANLNLLRRHGQGRAPAIVRIVHTVAAIAIVRGDVAVGECRVWRGGATWHVKR